jgi:adenylate cyclase
MTEAAERKLTTIFSADAAGYSRLMGVDEQATLAALQAHRAAIGGLIASYGGRIVNTAGDSILAEFGSVVKAVECAITIQRGVTERNAPLPEDRRMRFRIGINLGDVMVEKGDLFGDGVNVAARLQGLADPGGILVSGTVHDLVKDKLTVGFDFLGARSLKNLASDVPVYRVMLQGGAAPIADLPRKVSLAQQPAMSPFAHRLLIGAATPAALIGFLFLINLFTFDDEYSSDGEWWFKWPAAVILLIFALRTIWRLKRKGQG